MKLQLPPNGRLTIEFEGHTTVIAVTFDKKNDRIVVQSDLLGVVYNESLEANILITDKDEALRSRVADLPFCSRSKTFFENNDIELVGQLVQYTRRQLLSYPHMGTTTVQGIENVLRRMFLTLRGS